MGNEGRWAAAVATAAMLLFAAPAAAQSSNRACPDWPQFGRTVARTFAAGCPSNITPKTVGNLRQIWFYKTRRAVTTSPAVVDGVVYAGDWSGTMYALKDGRLVWETHIDPAPGAAFGPIVSSPAITDIPKTKAKPAQRLVVFGAGPRLYALDARTGKRVWVHDASAGVANTFTEFESSPLIYKGRVYIGIDTHGHPEKEVGGVRGGLLVLSARTGKLLWAFHPELDNPGQGCGGVWSSPTLDATRKLVFFGTANCGTDAKWTPHTEAITALQALPKNNKPRVAWTFQPHAPNRKDWDFGAAPNLFTAPNGTPTLGAGNKDGYYYALDPATGRKLWATQVAAPGDVQEDFSIGGFLGSPAIDHGRVYGSTAIGGPPFFHALDGGNGGKLWSGVAGPGYASSATVNGVVFHAALDTLFKAFDARTGALLWVSPLLAPGASGPAITGDRVYVGSGVSSSDLCVKGTPIDSACEQAFNDALGSLGGVTAYALPSASRRRSHATPRIVGGSPSPTPPWMAQVWSARGNRLGFCGGQLITTRWVLTAAHCVTAQDSTAPLALSALNLRIGAPRADSPPAAEFATPDVDELQVDPAYAPAKAPGDVALLHLPAPVAALPLPLGAPGTAAPGVRPDALGWGRINNSGDFSNELLTVPQPILDGSVCTRRYSGYDNASMVCAGAVKGQDSCSGDSGGPLVLGPNSTTATLLGTIDFGSQTCADGSPAVHQRMTEGTAANWVRSIVSLPQITTTQAPTGGVPAKLAASIAWPDATFAWDLDGDGGFDDAAGPAVTASVDGTRTVSVAATSAALKETAVTRTLVSTVPPLTVSAPTTAREGALLPLRITPNGGTGTLTITTTGMTRLTRTLTLDGTPRTINLRLRKDRAYHSPRRLTISLRTTGALRLTRTRLTVTVKDRR